MALKANTSKLRKALKANGVKVKHLYSGKGSTKNRVYLEVLGADVPKALHLLNDWGFEGATSGAVRVSYAYEADELCLIPSLCLKRENPDFT